MEKYMWRDNEDKIEGILDSIEIKDKEIFPVNCPLCGKREGHAYFHRNQEGNEQGSMWVWCSACRHSAHARYRLPQFWRNLEILNVEKLASYPDYLEENKARIDAWVNELLFMKSGK